ncbi:MAG: signal peptide peptidase SppA, type [Clostridia bacterium]|jgi:protease-4|nr:signal peptide peptidase SppA, type [Clostridia bacterium]
MEPKKKKGSAALTIGVILLGIILFVGIWAVIIALVTRSVIGDTASVSRTGDGTIDVIYVEGVIGEQSSIFGEATYNHTWTIDQIDELMYTESNKAILLYVNSPGGGVYESDELYLKLKEYKEVTGRPVYAYMAQTAASGGYYICMAADKVYANRMTMTGSIGVIMSIMDTSELEKKIGIKTENIVSGKNKAMGNPLTDEQRGILQSMIDETYNIFVQIVSENRGLSVDKTKELADGRIYTATQAKALNLIDEVGDFNAAVSDLKETYELQNSEVYDVINEQTFFDELFGTVSQKLSMFNEFGSIQEYIKNNNQGKLMYYYE